MESMKDKPTAVKSNSDWEYTIDYDGSEKRSNTVQV